MKALQMNERKENVKRAKNSYEIAGQFYLDINKVKSKSRAILNIVKDGEKITGHDSEFLKELLELHEKKEQKMRDFDHFEVGVHPQYEKTRCFFVVRKDGSKEDFSVTKCI
jgi:predicted secreted Zn-dependent protease